MTTERSLFRTRQISVPLAVTMTVLGSIVPGVGLIVAGRRKLGLTVLAVFVALCGFAGYLGFAGQRTLLHWSVEPLALLLMGLILPSIGAVWCIVVIATYRSLRPNTAAHRRWHLVAGNMIIVVLALAVLAPFVVTGRYALIQRGVVNDIFSAEAPASTPTSTPTITHTLAPAPAPPTSPPSVVPDPWDGRDRVNVLLLGGDAGADRTGTRTDTIILASIDTHTGNTVLFSIPRNLQKAPFPAGSALRRAYPEGFHAPGDAQEQLITEVYENVPMAHPDLIDATDPGAVAVKQAVSGVLDIPVDYYVLVNLKGFEKLIDALGGLTLNVNERVAIGGEEDAGLKPHAYIEEGPNQHMDGWKSLWFARGRYGASDWDRMLRQRCVIKAIIDQANPVTLLTRYEAIAKTSKDILKTDIPATKLPAFVDLALKVKNANVTNIAFLLDVIKPSNPDFAKMRTMVRQALQPSETSPAATTPPGHVDTLSQVCAYKED